MRAVRLVPAIFAVAIAAGCATTKISQRQQYEGPRLARPQRILVYNFAATQSDIPPWAAGANRYAGQEPAQTEKQLAAGRELGEQVAEELVTDILAMGLPAQEATLQTPMQEGDIAIVGYFESVQTGSAAERIALGFGAGAASLRTRVEGYEITPAGPRELGSGVVAAGDSKGPGLVVPLAVTAATANPIGLIVGGAVKVGGEVTGEDTIKGAAKRTAKEISDQLRVKFQEQGWI